MLDISRAIGEKTTQTYYKEKWAVSADGYYSQNATLRGHWYGMEAQALGLVGETDARDFERIMSGRRPNAQFDPDDLVGWERQGKRFLIRDQATNTVQAEVWKQGNGWKSSRDETRLFRSAAAARNATHRSLIGKEIHYSKEEKARRAWDIVSRPGKSVSVAAVVGGDKRIVEAHRRANTAMLKAIEQLIQARGGGNNPAVTTGRFVVARFEHYTARPEEVKAATGETILYPAALLHTHNVMANWTRTEDGKIRSIDPHELFVFQALGKAVYQAHMAHELRQLGYQVEYGKNGAPEIAGYTKEYLDSESLRHLNIQKHLQEVGLEGARAAQLIAKGLRNEKLDLSPEEIQALHRANAAAHGHQNERIVREAIERALTLDQAPEISAEHVVTMAKRSLAERYSVFEHYELVTKALEYGQGHVLEDAIEREIRKRTQTQEQYEQGVRGEFMIVDHVREGKPGLRYATDIQHTLETDLCELMVQGREKVEPLARHITAEEIADRVQSLAPLQSERDVRMARQNIEEVVSELHQRVHGPVDFDRDSYWKKWTADEDNFRVDTRNWYEDIDAAHERFRTWREAEVERDTKRLINLEKRLEQLQGLELTIDKNRVAIKLDAVHRFESLTNGFRPNKDQVEAIHTILTSPDRISAIVGVAGSGKSTSLQTIQAVAQDQGYRVLGLAPTSKAVEKLEQNGIRSATLQGFLLANSPQAVEQAKESIRKAEERLEKLEGRRERTKAQIVKTEQSLAKASIALGAAKERFQKAEYQATHGRYTRSIGAWLKDSRRREYFAAQLPGLAASIQKIEAWQASAAARLDTLRKRIEEIEQSSTQTAERLERVRTRAFSRGVSLDGRPRLIFADESSLAGNRQFAELFRQLSHKQDRLVLVGDPGQHESIEAARAFDLLLQAGIRRGEIYQIVRQKDDTLRAAVEKCTWGKHHRGLDLLKEAGHVIEQRKRADRLQTIVHLFQRNPDKASVIVPDNRTRLELNELIRAQWKETGRLQKEGLAGVVLVPQQEMTLVDREVAAKYEVGQVLLMRDGDEKRQIGRGSYWTVSARDTDKNQITVYRPGAEGALEKRTFDPERLAIQIEVYEKQEREFAVGDRVLFKKNSREHGIVNGSAAVVTGIDPDRRQVTIELTKTGKPVSWILPAQELSSLPHVEHGYVTTSYSIQGDTSGYTYAHFDTGDKAAKRLLSQAMMYVAISRPEYECKIVTNDAEKLRRILQTAQEKAMALSPEERYRYIPEEHRHLQNTTNQGMALGA